MRVRPSALGAIFIAELLGGFQFFYKWGSSQWSAAGTLAAVAVALIGSAQARADARRQIAANDFQHRLDVHRLHRQHKESLQQAAFLHKRELDRSESRHRAILAREHVREQIAAASAVVTELGALMLPTNAMCEALDDLGGLIGTRPSTELVAQIDHCVRTFTVWTEALLVFNSKVVAAEMVTTDAAVFAVLRDIKRQVKTFGDLLQQQQATILGRKQPGNVPAIRASFSELAKLSEPLRKAVAYNLRPVLLDDRPGDDEEASSTLAE